MSFCQRSLVLLLSLLGAGPAAAAVSTPPRPSTILGGEVVAACAWPTAVSIGGSCTGTLIHPSVVVYAAHCGEDTPWVRFGDRIEDPNAREVEVERCAVHPVGEYGLGTDFAYCLLAEPVTDVPIVPVLVGCEAEQELEVGRAVTLVGFGDSADDVEPYGVKREVEVPITDFSWDEVYLGDSNGGACYGDSGGPAFLRLPDGGWRVFGVASWGQPGCGVGTYYQLLYKAVEWIEEDSGVDVTPCHDGLGQWDPGPECGGFAIEPGVGGGSWPEACEVGALGESVATCGEAYDGEGDVAAPAVEIVEPMDRARIEPSTPGTNTRVIVRVEVDDGEGSGAERATVQVVQADAVVLEITDEAAPFLFRQLVFPEGVWTLRASVTDRVGNVGEAQEVVIGIGVDPPEAPVEPDTTGTSGDSEGEGGNGTSGADTTGSGDPEEDGDPQGCGCTSAGPVPWGLALLGIAARRRRRAVAVVLACAAACGSDPDDAAEGTEASSSEGDAEAGSTTGAGTIGESTEGGETAGDETTAGAAPACGDGHEDPDEACDDGNLEDADGCNAECTPSGERTWEWQGEGPANAVSFTAAGAWTRDGALAIVGASIDAAGLRFAWAGLLVDREPAWIEPIVSEGEISTRFNDVEIDGTGALVAVGSEYDPNEGIQGALLAKYDPSGELMTIQREDREDGIDSWTQIVVDGQDRIRLLGYEGVDQDRDPTFVLSFRDAGGTEVLARRGDETDVPVIFGTLALAPDDDLVLVAIRLVDPRTGDFWLRRFDAAGQARFTNSIGDPLTVYQTFGVAIGPDQEIYTCGELIRGGANEPFVARFSRLGVQEWIVRYDGPGQGRDVCYATALAEDGTLILAGSEFHPDFSQEAWLARMDPDGTSRYERLHGNDDFAYDTATELLLDADGLPVLFGSKDGKPWVFGTTP